MSNLQYQLDVSHLYWDPWRMFNTNCRSSTSLSDKFPQELATKEHPEVHQYVKGYTNLQEYKKSYRVENVPVISLIVARRASISLIGKKTRLNVYRRRFRDRSRRRRFFRPALKRKWRSGRDVLGHEIFLRNGKKSEKTRYASDCGSSKRIGAAEDDEKKKEKDKDNDDEGQQVYYLNVGHVPVDFWTFQSDKISRKRIWMMYEDDEREGKGRSLVNWDQIESSCRGRWNCRNLMRSPDWVPIDSLQTSSRPLYK